MKIILAVILLLILQACGPPEAKNDWPDRRLNKWLDYYELAYDGFDKTYRFERSYDVTYEYKIENDNLYSAFYVYNADSTKAIDLDSYHLALEKQDDGTLYSRGREPDMEVALIRFEEGERIRMLFCGTPCVFEEATFDPEGRLVVAGHVENANGYKPVMWVMSPTETYVEQHIYLRYEELIHPAQEILYIPDIRLSEIVFWHEDKKPFGLDIPL